MKNLGNRLKEKISENKINRRCLALLLALSMTVGFVMPYEEVFESALTTAVAAAGREDGDKIMEAYETAPSNAISFEKAITDFSVQPGTLTVDNNTGKATAKLNLSYEFTSDSGVNLNNRYIYYKPDGVTANVPFDYTHNPYTNFDAGATAKDSSWDNDRIAAYFSVSTDGLIVVKLTEEYINEKVLPSKGEFKGKIAFNGEIGRAATASGDREFGIGNNKITIPFDDIIKENSKTSEIKDVDGNMVVHYTINVKNPAQNVEFQNYEFVDTLIRDRRSQISNIDSNPSGLINKDTLVFSSDAKNQSSFTIEYDYTLTKEEIEEIISRDGKIRNEASITNRNKPEDKATTENETEDIRNELKATLEKTGKASYLINENELGYIQWKIDVERGYGFSLKDYTITDDAFSWVGQTVKDSSGNDVSKAEIVSVKDKNGNNVSYTPVIENGNKTNKITINDDTDNVKIIYKTYVDNSGNLLAGKTTSSKISNTAAVKNPDDKEEDTKTPDVPYSEASSVVKEAEEKNKTIEGFDKLNKPDSIPVELKWNVDISNIKGIGGKVYKDTLDESPEKQWFTNEQIEAIKQSINNNGLSASDYTFTTTGDNNKYTGFEITFKENVANKKITITYNSTAETKDIAHNDSDSFKNIGTFDNGTPDDDDITVTRGNDPYNNNDITQYSANKYWEDGNNPNRPNNAYIMLQYRVEGETEWKDYPQELCGENPKPASYNWSSWNNLPKHKPEIGNEPQKNYYYRIVEVVKNADDTYEIKAPDNYKNSYSIAYNDNETYDIDTGFNADNNGNKTLDITNTYAYFDATINKSWVNAPANHPTVKFTLYQSTDQNKWEKVNINGLENPKTLLADDTSNRITFEKLPKKDDNGNTLYYKVEESADGNALADYVTTYGEYLNGVDNKTSMTVTNTYQKMAITAKKQWIGDEGSTDRPASVSVHLEKTITKDDENSWKKVGDSVALNSGNKWAKQWTDLPRKDASGNIIYYRVREDENQASDYEENYEVKYVGDPNGYNTDYVVQNIWKKVNITPQKKWVGDTADTRSNITAILQYKIGANGQWQDHTTSDIEVIKNAADIPITSSDKDWIASTSWKNLPREVDGQKYYYRAVEETVPNGYVETYDGTGLNQTGKSVITNTLNTIEITPAKEWKDDGNHTDKRYDVEFKLQWKYEKEDGWNSITEEPVSYGTDKIITINKTDGNTWEANDKWTNLPKIYTDPETNVRKDIQYQVVEVSKSDDYTASPSLISSVTNTLTVTNTYKYIDITAAKKWAGDTPSDRPDKITVHLEQSTDGTSWEEVENSKEEITIDKSQTIIASLKSWENLPKKTSDGTTILYKVVESSVEKYAAAYDKESISETGTVTITNTKKGTYSKTAIDPTVTIQNMNVSEITGITSISKADLAKVPTDGDYYVFKYKVTIPTSEKNITYTDTLPDDAIFVGNACDIVFYSGGGSGFVGGKGINVTKNDDGTVSFYYDNTNNVDSFVYSVKVLKSTVDAALENPGYYDLTNTIKQEGDEGNGETAILTIGQQTTAPDGKANISKSYTGGDKENAYAKYSIELNPDAKKLSNEDYLDISDIFEVTGYREPSTADNNGNIINEGTLHRETGLLDATIHDIVIEDLDNLDSKGNPTKLTDYVYFPPEKQEENEFVSFVGSVGTISNDGTYHAFKLSQDMSQGSEFVIEITGTSNAEFSFNYVSYGYDKKGFTMEAVDSVTNFDANGKAKLKITFTEDIAKNSEICFNVNNSTGSSVIDAGATQKFIKSVNTLRVPDETHLRITYYYSLTANEKTPASGIAGTDPVVIGARPPAGSEVYFKNEASFNTSDGKEISEAGEQNFIVQRVNATIQTGNIPSIEKVNIGNYKINNLNATFKLAKYVNGSWKYATEFTTEKEVIQIAYGENNTENGGKVPSAAADLTIDGPAKINLESNVLYKLVETDAPEGYVDTLYKADESVNTDKMKNFVFYFVYAGNASAFADVPEAKGKIMQISNGGTVDIPNVKYIDVSASKTWAQNPDNLNGVKAEFELFYSYKRSNNMPAESDLKPVSDLGVSDSIKTITFTNNNNTLTGNKVEWKDLPNGKDGKAIYYYVREKSYTIGGTTYTLNTTDGNYYNSTDKGDFKNLFAGNGINETGEVKFTNTKGLYVRKEWRTSDNGIMPHAPVESIQFNLYGKNASGEWDPNPINLGAGNNVLGNSNNWQQSIDSELLTGYSDFKVEEVKKDADGNDLGVTLYGYVVSYTKNLNGNSGILNISNKNPNATSTDFIVKKEWADGLDPSKHTEDISVTLYQSTTAWAGYTPTDAEKLSSEVIETVTLNAGNEWSHTWEDLANTQEENGQRYYYYAVEDNVPENFTASYEKTGLNTQVETITNTPEEVSGKLTVQKKWEKVSDSNQEEITLNLYRRKKALNTNAYTFDKEYKIACVGDSITYGEMNNDDTSKTYPKQLAGLLGFSESNVSNHGHNNYEISGLNNGSDVTISDWSTKADVICLIIGTNNLIKSSPDTPENTRDQLEEYIDSIKTYTDNNGNTVKRIIFVGSIPEIRANKGMFSGNETTVNNNIKSYNSLIKTLIDGDGDDNTIFVEAGSLVDMDTMSTDGVHPISSGYKVIANAFYKAIGKKFGSKNTVDTSIQTDIDNVPADLATNAYEKVGEITLNDENNWTKVWTGLEPKTTVDGIEYQWIYYVEEVKPDGKEWEIDYQHNGQPANGQMTITVKNTGDEEIEKLPVKVVKVWKGSDGQETDKHPDSVTVQLYSCDFENGNYSPVANTVITLNADNDWSYEWEVEKGKYYKVVETKIAGWKSDSTKVHLTGNDEGNTITLTNTPETGSLNIEKSWLNDVSNADSVQVELYRVAVDENGRTISDTPQTETARSFNSSNGLYSLSRFRRAVSELEAQEEVQETTQPETEETSETKSSGSLSKAKSAVSAKAVGAGETCVKLSPVESGITYNLADDTKPYYCGDKDIKRIEVEFNNDDSWYNFSIMLVSSGETKYTDSIYTLENNLYIVKLFGDTNAFSGNIENFKLTHNGGCTVKEIRFIYDMTENLRIVCGETKSGNDKTPINVEVINGDSVRFSVEPSGSVDWKYGDNTSTGETLTFTPTADTKVEVTDGTAIRYANVTVKAFQITGKPVSITEGEEFELSTNADGEIDWSFSRDNIITYDRTTKKFKAVGSGEVTITATRNGTNISDSFTINVEAKDFGLSAEDNRTTLHKDGTVQLNISGLGDNPSGIAWSSDTPAVATVSASGFVTAAGDGTAKITATRSGKTAEITINVVTMMIKGKNTQNLTIGSMDVNSSEIIEFVNNIGDIEIVEGFDKSVVSVEMSSDTEAVIKSTYKENANTKVTFRDSEGDVVTVDITTGTIEKKEADIPEGAKKIDTITINKGDNDKWVSETVSNLPITDGQGHYYQYYIKETSTGNYIPISYDNGKKLDADKTTTLGLTNKTNETSSVELPETGGTGTKPYTAAGFSLIATSAAIMFIRRRKRRSA